MAITVGPHLVPHQEIFGMTDTTERRTLPDATTATWPEAALDYVIAALHPSRFDAVGPNIDCELLDQQTNILEILLGQPITLIDLGALTTDAIACAARLGLSLPILKAIGSDEIGSGTDESFGPVLTPEELADEDTIRRYSGFTRRRYQSSFFTAHGFVTIDPLSGNRLISTHSFLLNSDQWHIAYRFNGVETFYLLVGQVRGEIVLCGFPRLRLVVYFCNKENLGFSESHKGWIVWCYQQLLCNIIQHRLALARIITTSRPATGVVVGRTENLGHYIWQDLAGLEEILYDHGTDAVKSVLVGRFSRFSIAEVFPELDVRCISFLGREDDHFNATFRLPFQHLRPTGIRMSENLRDRILRVADNHVAEDVKYRIRQMSVDSLLVWVNLRAHNKMWARQIDGHVIALRKLAKEVGKLRVILDGLADTRDIADAIRRGLEPDIETIDTTGCDIFQSVLWARAVHVYSSVVSTGLVFTAWLARRPGVAHSNTGHLIAEHFLTQSMSGACKPTFLKRSEVHDLSSEFYGNYDFDPDLLYNRLRSLVLEYYPDKLCNSGNR
jgi:hypothetical protein